MQETITAEMLSKAKELLQNGTVNRVLGWKRGEFVYDITPAVFETPREIFGADNYFIEIQNHGIDEQKRILPDLYRLSRELDIPLVATNDAHYIRREDSRGFYH